MIQFLKNLILHFSSNRIDSQDNKNKAVSKQGSAQANSGSHVQQVGGDFINNIYLENKNPIKKEDAWWKLLHIFRVEDGADWFISQIIDPRSQRYLETCVEGCKNYVKKAFEAVFVDQKDQKELCFLHKKAIQALDSFVGTKNEEDFRRSWKSILESLSSLIN